VLVVVIYLVAAMNGSWWTAVAAGRSWSDPATWLFMVSCFVVLAALHFFLLAAVAHRWIVKPLLGIVVLASATAAYFMSSYSVLMDPTMIQNIVNTDVKEARDLLSWSLLGTVFLWSLPPLVFVWLVRVERQPWLRSLLIRLAWLAGALLAALLFAFLISRDLTSLMRSQKQLRYLITPGNLINGFASQLHRRAKLPAGPRAEVGADARRLVPPTQGRPRIFVFVVGETARAANFSLFGYSRETNPELAKLDVIGFSNVTSCGTSTEVSLPCMFAPVGREDYDESRIRGSQGLLDVLVRAGYAVKWFDNQSGCKNVCTGEGVESEKMNSEMAPALCSAGECLDEILLRRLQEELPKTHADTVFVLHMMGNHGPAYYRRYPPPYRRFVPDCATAQLRECSRDEVVNTYDNAILYTDHVLAALVGILGEQAPQADTAMLYVSDHGESLGENGLYLHGLPYAIAPKFQTHVPMIAWLSPQIVSTAHVDVACLRARSAEAFSHGNLFHSILGLLDVGTSVYQPGLDIFKGCRSQAAAP
jgi:lipid A ethanolaminephosphotransferase